MAKIKEALEAVLLDNMGGTPDLWAPDGGWDAWDERARAALALLSAPPEVSLTPNPTSPPNRGVDGQLTDKLAPPPAEPAPMTYQEMREKSQRLYSEALTLAERANLMAGWPEGSVMGPDINFTVPLTPPAEPAAEAPRRRYEILLKLGGDDWDAALRILRRTAEHIEDHGPECSLCEGGYDSGGYVHITHDPDMTHDKYVEAIEAWKRAPAPSASDVERLAKVQRWRRPRFWDGESGYRRPILFPDPEGDIVFFADVSRALRGEGT